MAHTKVNSDANYNEIYLVNNAAAKFVPVRKTYNFAES